jgi:hypothetical protein
MNRMILNEQDLLEKYYKAERTCINEFHSNIGKGMRDLIKEVAEYAEKWDLTTEFVDEDHFTYFEMNQND